MSSVIDSSSRAAAQRAWDEVSAEYLAGRDGGDTIDFGPLCPLEGELRLLEDLVGDVRGLSVLDAGCGGGYNAIRFADQGSAVTAVDFSHRQLAHAQRMANQANVDIQFLHTNVEALAGVSDASQDLVLCSHVLPYVEQVEVALASFQRVLRSGGWLVISVDHPFRACFYDVEDSGLANYAERSYFTYGPRAWRFGGTGTLMRSFDRPVGAWVDLLHEAGLPIRRMLEPPVPVDILDDVFPEDGPLASLRNVPHTLILAAGGGSTDAIESANAHE